MSRSKILVWIMLAFVCHSVSAQVAFKGVVLSSEGTFVEGATVRLEKSQRVVLSGSEGRFEILSEKVTDTLSISYMGYKTQRVAVSSYIGTEVTIYLVGTESKLDDLVVSSGYVQIPKERITGSFEQIDQKLINRSVGGNILSRLEGVSSLYFDNRSGNTRISLRGRSTIMGNANLLLIVDGFVFDGDINAVNPNDVKNITLLKDASAASIWGARAANGVVVIETNKGRFNQKPNLDFTSNFTISEKPDLYYNPVLESRDFIESERFLFDRGFYNSTLANQRFPLVSPAVEIMNKERLGYITAEQSITQLSELAGRDVRKDLNRYFYRNRIQQQYALSYRGGSSRNSYNISAGWDENREALKGDETDRLTLMTTTAYHPVKNLHIEGQIAYSSSKGQRNNPATEMSPSGRTLLPYAALADDTGKALGIEKDFRVAFLDTTGGGRLLDWAYRPLDEMFLADNTSQLQNLRMNLTVRYSFLKDFSFEMRYQNESQTGMQRQHYSQETYLARNLINRFTSLTANGAVYGVPLGGILHLNNSRSVSQTGRGQLNYNGRWNSKHALTAIAGTEIRQVHSTGEVTRTYGYNDNTLVYGSVNYADLLPVYYDLTGSQRIPNLNAFSDQMYRYVSFYGNAAYTLVNRYSVSFSSRKDASNLFGVNHNQKGTPLWSAGAAWDLSRESFYKVNILDYLKARISYGFSGNVDNSMSALTTVAFYSNAPLSGYSYAMVQNPGDPDLRWERSGMFNAGVDFSLKNNILSGTIEYYFRKGTDLIGEAPIDPTTGVKANSFFLYKGNVAHMKGFGIDADIHLKVPLGKVYWESDLILGYARNEVTRYLASSAIASAYVNNGSIVSPVLGKPVYAIYSYRWAGLDPDTGDPVGYIDEEPSKNYNAITRGTPSGLHYHGSAVPTLFGSYRNTLIMKNLSVSFNMLYKLNYFFRRNSINYGTLINNWRGHEDYNRRWQESGDENHTNVPSMVYPNIGNRDVFYGGSEVLVEKGDHVRFQDINISYQLKKVRISGIVNNLGIIWKANKSGLDPDYFSGGIPATTSFSLGFKTTL